MDGLAFGTRHRLGGARAGLVLAFSVVLLATAVSAVAGEGSPTVGAMTASGYGGRAYGVWTHIPLVGDATYADTGNLPANGGALFADFTGVSDSVASATVWESYTRGFNDTGRSEVATSDIALLPGDPNTVVASFGYVGATATCSGASGTSEIPDLSVGGVSVPVSGLPNQVYQIPGVLTLVINEQIDHSSGNTYDMTVNALHLTTVAGVEAIVASARSVVTCGSGSGGLVTLGAQNLAPPGGISPMWFATPSDFMTGGGYFFAQQSCLPTSRVNFGFNAGPRPGDPTLTPKGHLNVIDHDCHHHLEGTSVDFYHASENSDPKNCRDWGGVATFDGTSGRYSATTPAATYSCTCSGSGAQSRDLAFRGHALSIYPLRRNPRSDRSNYATG